MLQRLGMAQALINDPEILFLDEPTDGIDPVGRREIRDLLLTLKGQGKTIFLNSHLLSEVERISDEIAILKRGRLIKKGRVQDFLSLKDQYELSLEGDHPTIRQSCDFLNILLEEQNSKFLISVNNDEHLNKLIDELRKNKIFIKGITPRKITLEDYFIEVIEEKGNL
jgi:ABC-2 type transport system ATP-binding protein